METKKRTCLKCNKPFDLTGPGNRICQPCRRINDRIPITEEQLQQQRGAKRHNGDLIDPLAGEGTKNAGTLNRYTGSASVVDCFSTFFE